MFLLCSAFTNNFSLLFQIRRLRLPCYLKGSAFNLGIKFLWFLRSVFLNSFSKASQKLSLIHLGSYESHFWQQGIFDPWYTHNGYFIKLKHLWPVSSTFLDWHHVCPSCTLARNMIDFTTCFESLKFCYNAFLAVLWLLVVWHRFYLFCIKHGIWFILLLVLESVKS